jgi:hypothetical protein
VRWCDIVGTPWFAPYSGSALRLSEGTPLDPGLEDEAVSLGPDFVKRTHVAHVVIDRGMCSPGVISFAKRAFGLTPVAVDGPELHRTIGH